MVKKFTKSEEISLSNVWKMWVATWQKAQLGEVYKTTTEKKEDEKLNVSGIIIKKSYHIWWFLFHGKTSLSLTKKNFIKIWQRTL